jgi:type IV secretory pathway VirB10-like protein
VKLEIAPRGTEIEAPPDDQNDLQQPPPPPPPPPMDQEEDTEQDEEDKEEEPEPEQDESDEAPQVPEEFMFDVEGVALDPDVMKFTNKAKTGQQALGLTRRGGSSGSARWIEWLGEVDLVARRGGPSGSAEVDDGGRCSPQAARDPGVSSSPKNGAGPHYVVRTPSQAEPTKLTLHEPEYWRPS